MKSSFGLGERRPEVAAFQLTEFPDHILPEISRNRLSPLQIQPIDLA